MALPVAFDPFAALGLPRDASRKTIRARYLDLARRYHPNGPNRHLGNDESTSALSDSFHAVQEAWNLLSRADNRERRLQLLKLLELQDEMIVLSTLLESDGEEKKHSHAGSNVDGHLSSDADEDVPTLGIQRRQTVLAKGSRALGHLGDRREAKHDLDLGSPSSPSKKSKWQALKDKTLKKADEDSKARRRKLAKLRRKELEAFEDYRDAMVTKFEAEEDAEKQHELYERARWKRKYFERAPRPTTELMRSHINTRRAVTEFTQHTPRQRNRSSLSYSTMSPVTGPGEGSQFLIPDQAIPKQQKSMHRRGWSSDISGDQTSSSDDAGDAHRSRKVSPPGHRQPFPRRSRFTHLANHWASSNSSSTDSATARRHSVEFQLVVRQPTDLSAIPESQDSTSDTPSASSRTPSPLQTDGFDFEASKFTVVPSTGAAAWFGMSPSEPRVRARSPSPVGHHRQLSLTSRSNRAEPHVSVSEGCQFAIEHLVTPQHHHVPFSHVHLLSRRDKAYLLGSEPGGEAARPAALLSKLRQFNPSVAAKFEVKPSMEEVFNFRLVYGTREVVPSQHQSFIALSYRRKLHVERHGSHFTLPLEPEIYQAVWNERKSDTEGVWIDQICIRQEDDEERNISMSAMDMVYRSARLVVVALDDIELSSAQGEILKNHCDEFNNMTHVHPRQRFRHKQPPYVKNNDLEKIIRTILGSSWFKRAWCRHEMRLAKHHVFLIPARRLGTAPGRDVLRFNSKTLAHLLDLATEVPWEPEIESVKPALHAFFRDRSKMLPDERQMRSHHGNFSAVVAEVFAMEAGGNPLVAPEKRMSDARLDKISIILNTLECGLALGRHFRIRGFYGEDKECFHDLSLLALAAGDPGVLCSVGQPLLLDHSGVSWLVAPTVADAGLNETKTLERLPDHAKFVTSTSAAEHFLQLDMMFLPKRENLEPLKENDFLPRPGRRHHGGEDGIDIARRFADACEQSEWGRYRSRYLIHDKGARRLFGDMKQMYINTLECVLQLGPDWMSDVCQRYSMSRWKVYLDGACDLLIALTNTNGKWPIENWNGRSAGFIMDFVNFLIIRGLPTRQLLEPEAWRPLCVERDGIKILTFAPVENKHAYPAIPKVLINPDYIHLARLWILAPRHAANEGRSGVVLNNSEWTLLGKSVLFSDRDLAGRISVQEGEMKDQQRVYGRRRNLMNGVRR